MLQRLSMLMASATLLTCAATATVATPSATQPTRRTLDQGQRYEVCLKPSRSIQTLKPFTSPRRVDANTDSGIFGYLGYAIYSGTELQPNGFYSVPFDATPSLIWEDTQTTGDGLVMAIGWLQGDRLCGIVEKAANFKIEQYDYVEYDFGSGDLLTQKPISLKNIGAFLRVGAYNDNDGYVYGYGIAPDGFNVAWTKAPASDISAAQTIRVLDYENTGQECLALCFNPDDNMFYGLNKAKQLVRITPDGTQTVLGDTPVSDQMGNYQSAMIYSFRDNALIANFNMLNDKSCLYKIMPGATDAEYTPLRDFENAEEFYWFVSPNNMTDPELPARPVYISDTFTDGALTGNFTVTMPSTWADGKSLAGDMTLRATVDGEPLAEVASQSGATCTMPATLSRGSHEVRLYAVKDGKASRALYHSDYYGDDSPAAPAEVVYDADEGTLDWSPVTVGEHGGYIDPAQVEYHVYLNGTELPGSPLKKTFISTTLPTDRPYAAYTFTVTASFNGHASAPTAAQPVACGTPLNLDVTIAPTADQLNMVKILNSDSDDSTTWHPYEAENGEYWFATGFKNKTMSDYLILPPIYFPSADECYSIDLDAALANSKYTKEYFQVYMGTTDTRTGLSTKIMDTQAPTTGIDEGSDHFSSLFTIPEPGTYYIAVKCITDKWQWGLMTRNIKVSQIEGGIMRPQKPTKVTAKAADRGQLFATVTFTAPLTLLNGDEIPADAELEAKITGKETVTVKCTPGETVTADVPTIQGDNVISVCCAYQGRDGLDVTRKVHTGVDVPCPPTNLQSSLTEDGCGVKLTWTPPTEGENGGYIDPEGLKYKIMVMSESYYVDRPITDFTINVPDDRPQALYYYGVVARNAAGEGEHFAESWAILGKSYPMPGSEDFTDNNIDLKPVTVITGTWKIDQPVKYVSEASAMNYALIGNTSQSDPYGRVALPRFSTEGVSAATLTLGLWNGNGSGAPVVKLCMQRFGAPDIEVDSFVPQGTGWTTATIELPEELMGQKWIWPYLYVENYGASAYPIMINRYDLTATGGVTGLTGDENTPVRYYDLQGRYLGTDRRRLAPGIYLQTSPKGNSKIRVE